MKKILKFLITFVIGLLVLFLLLQKVGWHRAAEALFLFFTWQGAVLVFLSILFSVISVLRWRFILKRQGNELSFASLFKLWLAGIASSYFTPIALLGGEVIRVIGLKKIKDSSGRESSWQESIVSVGTDKIFDATVFLFFLMAGMSVFAVLADFSSKIYTTVTWFCLGLLGVGIFLFYFKKKEGPLKWLLTKILGLKQFENSKNGRAIFEIEKEIGQFFSFKKIDFWKAIGLSFLKYTIGFLRIIFLFYFLTQEIHIFKSLAIYGFYNLALFFPMPAALGSLEGAGALIFSSLGYGLAKGIVFAFLARGGDLILALSGLLFLAKIGFNLLGEKILKWIDQFGSQKDEI